MSFFECKAPGDSAAVKDSVCKQDQVHGSLILHVLIDDLDQFGHVFGFFIGHLFPVQPFLQEAAEDDWLEVQVLNCQA